MYQYYTGAIFHVCVMAAVTACIFIGFTISHMISCCNLIRTCKRDGLSTHANNSRIQLAIQAALAANGAGGRVQYDSYGYPETVPPFQQTAQSGTLLAVAVPFHVPSAAALHADGDPGHVDELRQSLLHQQQPAPVGLTGSIQQQPQQDAAHPLADLMTATYQQEESGKRCSCGACCYRGTCMPGGKCSRCCCSRFSKGKPFRRFNWASAILIWACIQAAVFVVLLTLAAGRGPVDAAHTLHSNVKQARQSLAQVYLTSETGSASVDYLISILSSYNAPDAMIEAAQSLQDKIDDETTNAYGFTGAAYALEYQTQVGRGSLVAAGMMVSIMVPVAISAMFLWSLCAYRGVVKGRGRNRLCCHTFTCVTGPLLVAFLFTSAVVVSSPLLMTADSCVDPENTAVSILTNWTTEWKWVWYSGDDPYDPMDNFDDDDEMHQGGDDDTNGSGDDDGSGSNSNNGDGGDGAGTHGDFRPEGITLDAWVGNTARDYFIFCGKQQQVSSDRSLPALAQPLPLDALQLDGRLASLVLPSLELGPIANVAAVVSAPDASDVVPSRPTPTPTPLRRMADEAETAAGGIYLQFEALQRQVLQHSWPKPEKQTLQSILREVGASVGSGANSSKTAAQLLSCDGVYEPWVAGVNSTCDGHLYSMWSALTLTLYTAAITSAFLCGMTIYFWVLYRHPEYKKVYVDMAAQVEAAMRASAPGAATGSNNSGSGGGQQASAAGHPQQLLVYPNQATAATMDEGPAGQRYLPPAMQQQGYVAAARQTLFVPIAPQAPIQAFYPQPATGAVAVVTGMPSVQLQQQQQQHQQMMMQSFGQNGVYQSNYGNGSAFHRPQAGMGTQM